MAVNLKMAVGVLSMAACLGLPLAASAVSTCVNTVAELQGALTTWSNMTGGDMTIKIVQNNAQNPT